MTNMQIRDVSLFVKVMGKGYPLVLMHGGPGLDYTTMLSLEPLADQFTLVFYDLRFNSHSKGSEESAGSIYHPMTVSCAPRIRMKTSPN